MYETYPEYADIRVLRKDFGIDESVDRVEEMLDSDWWCVLRRSIKYSSHSDSSLVEVYVLIKKPYGKENFQAGSDGKILYVGQGRRKELVYTSQPASGARRFVIVDTVPVKAFYLRHKGEGYRAFRFSSELHFVKETRNKLDVYQYLQSHMDDVHPVFSRQYFARLVEFAKGEKDNNQAELQEKLLQEFRRPIAAFKKLQAVENEERARMEEQRRRQQAESMQAVASSTAPVPLEEARVSTPPPSQTGGVFSPDMMNFGGAQAQPSSSYPVVPPPTQQPASHVASHHHTSPGLKPSSVPQTAHSPQHWIEFDSAPTPQDSLSMHVPPAASTLPTEHDVLQSFGPPQ